MHVKVSARDLSLAVSDVFFPLRTACQVKQLCTFRFEYERKIYSML